MSDFFKKNGIRDFKSLQQHLRKNKERPEDEKTAYDKDLLRNKSKKPVEQGRDDQAYQKKMARVRAILAKRKAEKRFEEYKELAERITNKVGLSAEAIEYDGSDKQGLQHGFIKVQYPEFDNQGLERDTDTDALIRSAFNRYVSGSEPLDLPSDPDHPELFYLSDSDIDRIAASDLIRVGNFIEQKCYKNFCVFQKADRSHTASITEDPDYRDLKSKVAAVSAVISDFSDQPPLWKPVNIGPKRTVHGKIQMDGHWALNQEQAPFYLAQLNQRLYQAMLLRGHDLNDWAGYFDMSQGVSQNSQGKISHEAQFNIAADIISEDLKSLRPMLNTLKAVYRSLVLSPEAREFHSKINKVIDPLNKLSDSPAIKICRITSSDNQTEPEIEIVFEAEAKDFGQVFMAELKRSLPPKDEPLDLFKQTGLGLTDQGIRFEDGVGKIPLQDLIISSEGSYSPAIYLQQTLKRVSYLYYNEDKANPMNGNGLRGHLSWKKGDKDRRQNIQQLYEIHP